jgi:hypothetical protein
MKELWKSVPYQPFNKKYLISSFGRVKPIKKSKYSKAKGRHLKPGVGARGYSHVAMYHNGLHRQAFIHRMVALAFLDNPPKGKTLVCHLNDNKLDNRTDNLVWGDPYDNMRHMVEHRRSLVGSQNPRALLSDVEVLTIRRLYIEGSYSQIELAATYGVDQTQISRVILRKAWKHI